MPKSIVFCADNKFTSYLEVAIKSLFWQLRVDSNNIQGRVNLYIFADKIPPEILKYYRVFLEKNSNINLYTYRLSSIQKKVLDNLQFTSPYLSTSIYSKLFIAEVLTNEDEVIYFDSDSLFMGNITELLDFQVDPDITLYAPYDHLLSAQIAEIDQDQHPENYLFSPAEPAQEALGTREAPRTLATAESTKTTEPLATPRSAEPLAPSTQPLSPPAESRVPKTIAPPLSAKALASKSSAPNTIPLPLVKLPPVKKAPSADTTAGGPPHFSYHLYKEQKAEQQEQQEQQAPATQTSVSKDSGNSSNSNENRNKQEASNLASSITSSATSSVASLSPAKESPSLVATPLALTKEELAERYPKFLLSFKEQYDQLVTKEDGELQKQHSPLPAIKEQELVEGEEAISFTTLPGKGENLPTYLRKYPLFATSCMILNLRRIRSKKYHLTYLRYLTNGSVAKLPHDQLFLNLLHRKEWRVLPDSYSFQADLINKELCTLNQAGYAEIKNISKALVSQVKQPKVIHYSGLNKPLEVVKKLPYRSLFFKFFNDNIHDLAKSVFLLDLKGYIFSYRYHYLSRLDKDGFYAHDLCKVNPQTATSLGYRYFAVKPQPAKSNKKA